MNVYFLFLVLLGIAACEKKDNLDPTLEVKVSSYYPNSGKAGTLLTIEGEGFSTSLDEYQATIGAKEAEVISATNVSIVIRIPEGGTTGKLVLKYGDKTIDIGTYTYQELSVARVFPANGPAGSQIRIGGAGFGSVDNPAKVFINAKEALVVSVTDTLIVAEIPVEAGSGAVMVKVDGKEAQGQNFKYQEIYSVKPLSGGANTRVTVTGEGFETLSAGNIVDFNGKQTTVLEATESTIVVLAPEEVSTGPLSVTINGQKITGPSFSVVPFPIIKSVAPLSAPKDTEITINGDYYSALSDEVVVTFNGIAAPVIRSTEKSITVRVPPKAGKGKILLSVNDQKTEGPEFREQNLGITKLLPDNGLAGDEITISGLGFSDQITENKVLFNGVIASIRSASDTALKVVVPSNVSTGTVSVEVEGLNARGPEFKRAGVITLAGGPNEGTFESLRAIAVDSKGNIFVAENNQIKKISPLGSVTNFAGSSTSGAVDNVGDNARFSYITGIGIDENDNIYVADSFNKRIRKVTPGAVVSTVSSLSFNPISLTADKEGNIYVGQSYGGAHVLNKLTGGITKIHQMTESPDYMAALNRNEFYYAPANLDYLQVFSIAHGQKSTYAGTGSWGLEDGPALSANFYSITGLAMTKENVLYVADGSGNTLRKVEDGIVTTLIGKGTSGEMLPGYQDGSFINARIRGVTNICVDNQGNVYVTDNGNKAVRKIFFK